MHRTISFERGCDKAAQLQGKHGSRSFIVVSEVMRYVIRYLKPQGDESAICAGVSISGVWPAIGWQLAGDRVIKFMAVNRATVWERGVGNGERTRKTRFGVRDGEARKRRPWAAFEGFA